MNLEYFVKRNIYMLDNNTISVDHLANKLCVTLEQEYGIKRTTEMEKYFIDIFTKYKRKEIDVDAVTNYLNPVVNEKYNTISGNVSTSNQKNTSSTSSSTTTSKSTTTSTKTVVEPKQETPARVTPNTEVTSSVVTETVVTPKEEVEATIVEEKPTTEQVNDDNTGTEPVIEEVSETHVSEEKPVETVTEASQVTTESVVEEKTEPISTTEQVNDVNTSTEPVIEEVSETPEVTTEPVVEEITEPNISEEAKPSSKYVVDKQVADSIKKNIGMLDNNTISVDHLTIKLINETNSNFGVNLTDTAKANLNEVLTKYKKHEISADDVVSYYENIINGDTYTTYTPNTTSKNYDNTSSNNNLKDSEVTAYIDTEIVMEASGKLADVESSVSGATIIVPSSVSSYTEGIEEVVEQAKSDVASLLDDSKSSLIEAVATNEEIDSGITPPIIQNYSFDDIYKMAYDKKQNSPVYEADAEFFKKCGYEVNGDTVTLTANGKEYRYNINGHTLTINGSNSVKFKILVPKNASNYSNLNTYTYFASTIKPQNQSQSYDELIYNQNTNAIILQFAKNDVQDKNGDNGKFIKSYEVAEATKFINAVANTDIASGKCRNIIGGDSRYGAQSLIMAAENPDLYQTVYCINNALIVGGVNGVKGTKTQFSSIADFKGLDGKDIYFISAAREDNFFHNNGWMVTQNYKNGYTYTGLELLCENCPNANVHMVYNDAYSDNNKELIKGLKELENRYSNYSYEGDKWFDYASGNYYGHTIGQAIAAQVASADTTNRNYYTINPKTYYIASNN